MEEKIRFAAVEFADDENVKGHFYWYLCGFDNAEEGDTAIAPLGRHNNLQQGIIRKVIIVDENNAPFPLNCIKYIVKVLKSERN